MDLDALRVLIKGGETSSVEFKAQPPRYSEVAERLCGLANGMGGKLIIGVENESWEIVGVKKVSEAIDTIFQAVRYCKPPLVLVEGQPKVIDMPDGKQLVIAQVPPNNGSLYQCGGVFWLRRGTHTSPMDAFEVESFFYRTGQLDWETRPHPLATLEDLDHELVTAYMERLTIITGKPSRLDDPWERLTKMECLAWLPGRDGKPVLRPTQAGLLLFGYSPRDFFTGAEVVATYYQDATGLKRYTDRRIIAGTLSRQIDLAEEFFRHHVQIGARIEGFKRIDEPEYSLEVLREALVNAVAHRDYSLKAEAVRVFFYSDRVEIHSPGTLLPGIELEALQQGLVRSRPRNQVIVSVLRDLPGNYMERVGSGIRFMLNQSAALGLPTPLFKEQGGEFVVTFMQRPQELKSYHSELPAYVSRVTIAPTPAATAEPPIRPEQEQSLIRVRRQELALNYIRNHGFITNKEYRALSGASENTALRDLEALVEQGSLRAVGKGRGRRYVL